MDKETLYKFFEGTTSYQEEEAIKKWLEESAENTDIFMKERKIYDALILLSEEISVEKSDLPGSKFSLLKETLKIASVILLTLVANYWYTQWQNSEKKYPMQVVSVPAGQRINLTLPDGTDVWLNAQTTLRYPAVFHDDIREIELDGEAWFDVVKNEEQPFVVRSPKAKVEVLGTTFNIRDYAAKKKFETTLISGSVRLISGLNPEQKVTLAPGTKGYMEDGAFKIVEVTDFNEYRWKDGLICFTEESFETIMEEFERYFGLTIQVKNPTALSYYYTGKFRQADGIDYALHILQKYIHFSYQRDEEEQLIVIE